jgi:hypothetical protein
VWLPFWSESQGVVDWAFRLSDRDSKDPPVFVSDPDDSHRPPADRAWHQENTHLGEFMFQMLVYQRTVSTPLGAFGWLTEGTSARALGFERIHLPVWTWPQPRSELFASDGVLAVSIASNPIQLFVAALDLGKLRQVLRRPGVHWETQIGT